MCVCVFLSVFTFFSVVKQQLLLMLTSHFFTHTLTEHMKKKNVRKKIIKKKLHCNEKREVQALKIVLDIHVLYLTDCMLS